jgi:hypothetical protein
MTDLEQTKTSDPRLNIEILIRADETVNRVMDVDVESEAEVRHLLVGGIAALMDVVSMTHSHYKVRVQEVPLEARPSVIRECRETLEELTENLCDFYISELFGEEPK